MVTIRDVAKHLGISVSTVSRCLNNYPDISEATRERIHQAMQELNYVPNANARSIGQKQTYTVGLTIPDIQDSFFAGNADGIEDILNKNGYDLIYGSLARSSKRLVDFLRRAREMRFDGIIITPDVWDQPLIEALNRLEMPVVVLRRKPPAGVELPYVDSDHYGAAREMMEYLISLGHRKIGHIAFPTATCRERLAGYIDVMNKYGLEPRIAESRTSSGRLTESINNGRSAMAQLHRNNPDLTAVFAASDQVAMGALEYLDKAGISVPGDISVAGFDNMEYADMHWFRLTTMALDRRESGRIAAGMLLKLIKKKVKRPQSVLLSPELVVRESTRTLK